MIARDPRRLRVGFAGHHRGDRRRVGPPFVAVVRQPARHQQGAEIRIPETQRTVVVAVLLDRLGRVARIRDDDLLRRQEGSAGGLERRDVQLAVLLHELHEVDRRQIARRVVQEHVLRAGIARIDATGLRARVPVVDRRIELHPGIAAHPRALRDHPHQVARLVGVHDLAVPDGLRLPLAIVQHGAHEIVGHAHAVIGVLEEDRPVGHARERTVIAGVDERPRLLLFFDLAADELGDVGMVGVQDHHLRRPAGLAA